VQGIDDKDLLSIIIPPIEYYYGINDWQHAEAINPPWDVVLYSLRKFANLLIKQNPNAIAMLWLEKEDYLYLTETSQLLIDERELFSSRQCYTHFVGYAKGQLNRMTHVTHRGYLGAKRKQLVEKYGYDCKNAQHLVRLLRMGKEFLHTGKLNVRRTWDRDLLISIKRGEWPLERVYKYTAELFTEVEDAVKTSPLPPRLDLKKINNLLVELTYDWLHK
jgi:hypothetical protein